MRPYRLPLGISVAQVTANIVGHLNTLVGLGARIIVLNAPTIPRSKPR